MANEAKRPLKQMAGRAGARVDEGGEAPMRRPTDLVLRRREAASKDDSRKRRTGGPAVSKRRRVYRRFEAIGAVSLGEGEKGGLRGDVSALVSLSKRGPKTGITATRPSLPFVVTDASQWRSSPRPAGRLEQRLCVELVQFEDAIVRNDKMAGGRRLDMRAAFRRRQPHRLRRQNYGDTHVFTKLRAPC